MTLASIRHGHAASWRAGLRPATALLLSTVGLGSLVAAQSGPRPQTPGGSGTVRGLVVGADTNLPVRDAVVMVRSLDAAEPEAKVMMMASSGRTTMRMDI